MNALKSVARTQRVKAAVRKKIVIFIVRICRVGYRFFSHLKKMFRKSNRSKIDD